MNVYQEAYDRLEQYYGNPGVWWPAEDPFEIVVGAVLTQNTNWKNVDKALEQLRNHGCLNYPAMLALSHETLADLIRPAGFYNIKATRLQNLFAMIERDYEGDWGWFWEDETTVVRKRLLAVKGIGAETADAILLYGGGHPLFVVDAYTHRIFSRHNMLDEETDYATIQETFAGKLDEDVALFRAYHGLIVELAKDFCKKTNPKCPECPLSGLNGCDVWE